MYFLGIDVGSISTDLVIIDRKGQVKDSLYLRTGGRPAKAIAKGLCMLGEKYDGKSIAKTGTTGSGRALAAALAGADVIKNEITAHGAAAAYLDPEIKTIIEIGGQDSKLILLEDGFVTDFAMNTVCAAGTGSFLDRQAHRMEIGIEDFGELALRGTAPVPIAGRCAVFAESDIIHQQQLGASRSNLIAGLCRALVQSYLSNVAQGKKLLPKICFQGGVAANKGIRRAFEEALQTELFVPKEHKIMGAYGAALLAREKSPQKETAFKGFQVGKADVSVAEFQCTDCSNRCRVVELKDGDARIGCFQDRCGKYQS